MQISKTHKVSIKFKNYHKMTNNISKVSFIKVNLNLILLVFILTNALTAVMARKQTNHHQATKRQQNKHGNISALLDSLLENYDNSLRPNFGGSPAVIEVDIMVRSMEVEVDMTYSMDCYFRQSWVDSRLAFQDLPNSPAKLETLALSISMLGKIWKPDTFFFNGKHSYLHTITTPNKFVRLHKNGQVLYSSRLTIKAGCLMNLEYFPMDVQRCPLKFGSFGYTTSDVLYRWNANRQVSISEDMKMSQFDLIDNPSANVTDRILVENHNMIMQSTKKDTKVLSKEYSSLLVSFHLKRHMGNFLIQVYGPCILLVVLSWVSFWLNREATADRISLGITTVLTMTFLGLEARTDLPKVSYPTALDFFVFLSFGFIFATIMQFAFVHYFTKYGSGECYFNFPDDSDSESSGDEDYFHKNLGRPNKLNNLNSITTFDDNYCEVIPLSHCDIPSRFEAQREAESSQRCKPIKKFLAKYFSCFEEEELEVTSECDKISIRTVEILPKPDRIAQRAERLRRQSNEATRQRSRGMQFNSVSKIDKISRIVFPLLFFIINLFYWYIYLSKSRRMSKTSN